MIGGATRLAAWMVAISHQSTRWVLIRSVLLLILSHNRCVSAGKRVFEQEVGREQVRDDSVCSPVVTDLVFALFDDAAASMCTRSASTATRPPLLTRLVHAHSMLQSPVVVTLVVCFRVRSGVVGESAGALRLQQRQLPA